MAPSSSRSVPGADTAAASALSRCNVVGGYVPDSSRSGRVIRPSLTWPTRYAESRVQPSRRRPRRGSGRCAIRDGFPPCLSRLLPFRSGLRDRCHVARHGFGDHPVAIASSAQTNQFGVSCSAAAALCEELFSQKRHNRTNLQASGRGCRLPTGRAGRTWFDRTCPRSAPGLGGWYTVGQRTQYFDRIGSASRDHLVLSGAD